MRYAIQFKATKDVIIPINHNHIVNAYLHKVLGVNNEFHDKYSNYNIAGIFGASLNDDKKTVTIEENSIATIIVSSGNETFNSAFYPNLMNHTEFYDGLTLFKTKRIGDEILLNRNVLQTLTPMLFWEKVNGKKKKITIADDNFVEKFTNYLKHIAKTKCNIYQVYIDELKITVYDKFSALKMIKVKDLHYSCSHFTFCIEGKYAKELTKYIYDNGIGTSRGYGFGMIVPRNEHINYVNNFFKSKKEVLADA